MSNFEIGTPVYLRGHGQEVHTVAVIGESFGGERVYRYGVRDASGALVADVHVSDLQPVPVVGMPCSVKLWTDTVAAVVTRVTRTRVTVRRVAVREDSARPVGDAGAYGLRAVRAEGDVSRPEGPEETYRWSGKRGRFIGGGDGSCSLILGQSFRFVDYRH